MVSIKKSRLSVVHYRLLKVIRRFLYETIDQLKHDSSRESDAKEIVVHYVSSAIVGVFYYWIESDLKYSKQYMAMQIKELETTGPIKAMGCIKGKRGVGVHMRKKPVTLLVA
ncbi:TetR family transcriptional regulator C-terminal domain-containing protein [Paenibacillus sp. J5C_2022]|uniref:TetR-like C-terminal domain-containing protein n=1 Tax=Paenibacillus sp. J5C2022 TaxID=2977129 RepID=UPI0021CEE553|nr:TetR-like C-terminal domain-containing protein [Paenibacillus sp. J5C2022]MCU6709028.1 TetR family transcriptional regulator C-terminal domain-containing protein [Paenibacillus sp. J5C2022]